MLPLLAMCIALPPASRALADPTEIRGVARGVDAVSFDPGAVPDLDGLELQLRSRFLFTDGSRWAGAIAVPVFGVVVGADYELLGVRDDRQRRSSLLLGTRLGPYASIGGAYRIYQDHGDRARVWDFGLLLEPSSLLSMSFGVDNLGEPTLQGTRLDRAWRAGVGVRPLLGSPRLVLGAEARLRNDGDLDVVQTRLLADASPIEGWHLRAGYVPGRKELWLGMAMALGGTDLRLTGAPSEEARQSALALTLRQKPNESLVTIGGRVVEVPLSGDLRPKSQGFFGRRQSMSPVPYMLDQLAADASVGTVILNIGQLQVGLATVEELRAAIHRLRESGKLVIAEIAGGEEREYMVAAAADKIRLDPSAPLTLDGFAVSMMYFASFLQKLGVRFDAVAIGAYKTAPDSLTLDGSRPEEKQVTAELLAQATKLFFETLVNDRHFALGDVQAVIDHSLYTPDEALKAHLVDELSQPTDVAQLPEMRMRGEGLGGPPPDPRWGGLKTIAVIPIVGAITSSEESEGAFGENARSSLIVDAIDAARTSPEVVGAVLRIDSPGGEVYASEIIWRAVRLLADKKPVVVSMGDVAASGGYYVAAPAHLILAEPTTITGSIGIFTVKPDLSGVLKHTEIREETYKVGVHADWDSNWRGLTDEERGEVRRGLLMFYDQFVDRVAHGRKLPEERVRQIAEGRVYTGEEALQIGLVDAIGSLADAVREVKLRAGLDEDERVRLDVPEPPLLLSQMVGGLVQDKPSPLEWLETLQLAISRLGSQAQARLPWAIEVR